MQAGDRLIVNGVDLLILDFVNNKPFVLAYNLDIETQFSDSTSNYKDSILRARCESWFAETGLKAIPRVVDLTTISGHQGRGTISADAAPLTFDEYRRYSNIIQPFLKDKSFYWTVTGWGRPASIWGTTVVAGVISSNDIDYFSYDERGYLLPAFILDPIKPDISLFPTSELIVELYKRLSD
jgi:hypothetical protein